MALPPEPWLRALYQFYFRRVLPLIGRLISRHATAYTWLPASTQTFPAPPELARRMAGQGFTAVSYRLFMGGVCAMHVGTRGDRSVGGRSALGRS
jgi:demethylmenaquinone methyltransferase/2-methoxy-6-polyprenyl-1,4-benzoquinol methylase